MGIIRLLLVIAVVAGHSTPIFGLSLVGGDTAVHAFYIISGFYMSLVLNEKYNKLKNSYRLFITNRLFRIYPAYWTVLILIVIFSVFQHYFSKYAYSYGSDFGELGIFWKYFHNLNLLSFTYILFTNIFIIGQDTLLFLGLTKAGGFYFTPSFLKLAIPLFKFLLVPQAWAVSLEMGFYFLAPFIVRKSWKFITLLIAFSLALRVALAASGLTYDPWTFRFFPLELVFFLIGNIAYRMYKRIELRALNRRNLIIIWCSLIILTILFNASGILINTVLYLAAFGSSIPFIFALSRNWRIDRYIGELAYPIYISHVFIITVINFFKVPGFTGTGIHTLLVTLPFSVVLYETVIKRVDIYRHRKLKQERLITVR